MDHSVYFVTISPGWSQALDDEIPLSSDSTLEHRDSSLVDDGPTSFATIHLIVKNIAPENDVLKLTANRCSAQEFKGMFFSRAVLEPPSISSSKISRLRMTY